MLSATHPLENRWSLWAGRGWKDTRSVGTVATVEDYLGVANNLAPPSSWPVPYIVAWFHEGVPPEWETPVNAKGGAWVACLSAKRARETGAVWRDIVYAVLGGTLPLGEHIVGLRLNKRRGGFRIAIWTRALSADQARAMGAALLALPRAGPIAGTMEYKRHADASAGGSAFGAMALVSM